MVEEEIIPWEHVETEVEKEKEKGKECSAWRMLKNVKSSDYKQDTINRKYGKQYTVKEKK